VRDDVRVCGNCLTACAKALVGREAKSPARQQQRRRRLISELVERHFDPLQPDDLTTTLREFPGRMRADLQGALESLFGDPDRDENAWGLHRQWHNHVEFPSLWSDEENEPIPVGPLQFMEVDIGEQQPVRCLKNALWLRREGDLRYAVLLAPARNNERAIHVEIAAPAKSAGARKLIDAHFRAIQEAVAKAKAYRGKVLSLEHERSYSGHASGIKVHRLRQVTREEVILPGATLELLDRNVFHFFDQREGLSKLDMPVKKGLLFHGPPGTGKTHTLHYLASRLKEHTTFLITAEQIGLLDEYIALARLLQPSIVVIEDADLVARRRERTGVQEEVMLNKLLNEMDGLRQDAAILFILTTNRPETLEAALTSRPGRIDQAISFPLPDEAGREKLVGLYSRGLNVDEHMMRLLTQRTDGCSASFIKELMRRTAQYCLDRSDTHDVVLSDVEQALAEMLIQGGRLTVSLLGGKAPA